MKRILSNLNLAVGVLLAFVLVQLVNFIALNNAQRWDWSGRQYYALSEKTANLLAELSQADLERLDHGGNGLDEGDDPRRGYGPCPDVSDVAVPDLP